MPPKRPAAARQPSSSSSVIRISSSGRPTKKLSTLSSFQSTLSFAPVRNDEQKLEERRRSASTSMPPPPVPAKRQKLESTPFHGKGKAREVIDFTDEDGEEAADGLDNEAKEMWTERFAPFTEAELALSKPRITKLKQWLVEALEGIPPEMVGREQEMSTSARERIRKYRRILLLTGPAGVGKTTALKVLARALDVELIEWGDGVEEWSLGDGFTRESTMSKLSSFLSRHAYAPLEFASRSDHRPRRRLLLMSSLPNLSHPATRQAFYAALQDFAQSFQSQSCPLVIIASASGDGGRAEESWMERDRAESDIGKEIRDSPWCRTIDFLPIAPTFLIKALNRIIPLAYPKDVARPPPEALQLIAQSSNGDLRSAVNSLEFLATQMIPKATGRTKAGGGAKKTGKGSRGGRGAKIDASEQVRALLDAVSRREQSLGLFHALGKVLYNKRLGDPPVDTDDQEELARAAALPALQPLPGHLAEFERTRSRIDIEAFIPTVPVDTSTFALWLHQSFPQFCTDIDQVSVAMDDFARADLMRTDEDLWQTSPHAIAYAFHIATRGLLMALPSPVPRTGQKILKPAFFEAFRAERASAEAINSAAAHIASRAMANSDWAGLQSSKVLVTETIPMIAKIQAQVSDKTMLPTSFASALITYSTALDGQHEELTEKTEVEDEELPSEQEAQGWVQTEEVVEHSWLEDDEIEDF